MKKMLKTFLAFFKQNRVKNLILIGLIVLGILSLSPQSILAQGIFGQISPPAGVAKYQEKVVADGGTIGLIIFISNLIKLVTVVAGVWTLFNFISAGWIYLNAAGDSSANEKASQLMTNSVIGLVIIAASYTIAGLVGYLIFDDAGFIFNAFRSRSKKQTSGYHHAFGRNVDPAALGAVESIPACKDQLRAPAKRLGSQKN